MLTDEQEPNSPMIRSHCFPRLAGNSPVTGVPPTVTWVLKWNSLYFDPVKSKLHHQVVFIWKKSRWVTLHLMGAAKYSRKSSSEPSPAVYNVVIQFSIKVNKLIKLKLKLKGKKVLVGTVACSLQRCHLYNFVFLLLRWFLVKVKKLKIKQSLSELLICH